jgi:hypothetical protein
LDLVEENSLPRTPRPGPHPHVIGVLGPHPADLVEITSMIRRMANCVVVSAAIRFDKLAVRYLATVRIATLAEWLR